MNNNSYLHNCKYNKYIQYFIQSCKHKDYDSAYNDLLSAASTMINWYKMNCMQANPEKFQFIIFDKERQPRTLQLNHNVTIQSVSNVQLLGVNIDVELNFNHHIALLCNKAGRQINALSRLSNVLNVDTKILILQSFILSHFMYCCIIWHFCSISDTKKIEKMQLKALRHIFNSIHTFISDIKSPYTIKYTYN